jgi:hypothetical protein
MLIFKSKKLSLAIFVLLGLGYFSVMSHLEIDDFWKSQVALMPVQIIAVIYFTYYRLNRR